MRHIDDSLALLPSIDGAMGDASAGTVVDVGSGIGMPGLAIAAARPHWRVTLLESLRKKCDFMEAAAEAMGLENVRVVCARAEDAAAAPKAPPRLSKRKARLLAAQVQHDEQATRHVGGAGEAPTLAPASPADHPETHRASYDVCIARAVAALPTLVELTLPFVRVGGALVASKEPYSSALVEVQDAHNAIAKLGGNPLEDVRVVPVDSFATSPSLGPPSPSAAFTAVVVSKSGPTPAAYPRRAGVPGKRPL